MFVRTLGCHRRGGLSELPRRLFCGDRLHIMHTSFQISFFLHSRYMPISIYKEIFLTKRSASIYMEAL